MDLDIKSIKNEELLRKMWQQTEDSSRRKEIHSHLYKLRESRLRDLYRGEGSNNIMAANSGAGFGKDPITPSHGDSLVDQSFQSLKSKEVRDSMSPTHDVKFHALSLNHPNSTGWDVQTSSEVTPDGRAFRSETLAKTDGVERINGGVAEFQGSNEQRSSGSHQGDDKNYIKKAAESSKTNLEEKFVTGDENSGRTEMRTSSKTSSSSQKVVSSSSTTFEDSDNTYLMDADHSTKSLQNQYEQQQRDQQRIQQEHLRQQQQQKQQQYQQHHEELQTKKSDHRQYEQSTEEYRRNQQKTNTSTSVETDRVHEENKHYVDMDKASPEYQQRVKFLMEQPGEIISNTVEYPKPNVKMITTVKKLPDGTIVKNKRYETEELRPATESTRQRQVSTSTNQSNKQSTNKTEQRHVSDQDNIYSRLKNSRDRQVSPSRNRNVNVDNVDNVETRRQPKNREYPIEHPSKIPESQLDHYTNDATNVATFSSVKKSSRRFSTETTSETVEEVDDRSSPQKSPHHSKHETQSFTTHGFPSVRSDKPTQEFASDRPSTEREDYRDVVHAEPRRTPRDEYSPNKSTVPTGRDEMVVVTSEKSRSLKNKTNIERTVETEVVTDRDDHYHHHMSPDFSTHGFPSVRGSSPHREGTPKTYSPRSPHHSHPSEDFSTHGFPSAKDSTPNREGSPRTFHPSSPRRSQPGDDFTTHGFPSVKESSPYRESSPRPQPSSSRPRSQPSEDFSTHGFPSAKSPRGSHPTTEPDSVIRRVPIVQEKPYGTKTPESTTVTKKHHTTTESTTSSVRKEKEVDSAHRAFAASLRSSSPVDSTYSEHQRSTPRSSFASSKTTTTTRRNVREGSHDSATPSETSRISTGTVTRQSPSKTTTGKPAASPHVVTKQTTVRSNETIDTTPQRFSKSPSPAKTTTTTTTTTKKTTVDVPKADNQLNKPAASQFPPINEPLTITKTQFRTNEASLPLLGSEAIVEEPPCIKKHIYQCGPSDKDNLSTATTPNPNDTHKVNNKSEDKNLANIKDLTETEKTTTIDVSKIESPLPTARKTTTTTNDIDDDLAKHVTKKEELHEIRSSPHSPMNKSTSKPSTYPKHHKSPDREEHFIDERTILTNIESQIEFDDDNINPNNPQQKNIEPITNEPDNQNDVIKRKDFVDNKKPITRQSTFEKSDGNEPKSTRPSGPKPTGTNPAKKTDDTFRKSPSPLRQTEAPIKRKPVTVETQVPNEKVLRPNVKTPKVEDEIFVQTVTNASRQTQKNIKNTAQEFIHKESVKQVPHAVEEIPDGALTSKLQTEPEPFFLNKSPEATTPTYRKKGLSRRETFEERCRHILGMEDTGDTQGIYKPLEQVETPDNKPVQSMLTDDQEETPEITGDKPLPLKEQPKFTEFSEFVVRVEDCEDDETNYGNNIIKVPNEFDVDKRTKDTQEVNTKVVTTIEFETNGKPKVVTVSQPKKAPKKVSDNEDYTNETTKETDEETITTAHHYIKDTRRPNAKPQKDTSPQRKPKQTTAETGPNAKPLKETSPQRKPKQTTTETITKEAVRKQTKQDEEIDRTEVSVKKLPATDKTTSTKDTRKTSPLKNQPTKPTNKPSTTKKQQPQYPEDSDISIETETRKTTHKTFQMCDSSVSDLSRTSSPERLRSPVRETTAAPTKAPKKISDNEDYTNETTKETDEETITTAHHYIKDTRRPNAKPQKDTSPQRKPKQTTAETGPNAKPLKETSPQRKPKQTTTETITKEVVRKQTKQDEEIDRTEVSVKKLPATDKTTSTKDTRKTSPLKNQPTKPTNKPSTTKKQQPQYPEDSDVSIETETRKTTHTTFQMCDSSVSDLSRTSSPERLRSPVRETTAAPTKGPIKTTTTPYNLRSNKPISPQQQPSTKSTKTVTQPTNKKPLNQKSPSRTTLNTKETKTTEHKTVKKDLTDKRDSSPDMSPTRLTERRRSSNISVHTEIIIDHTPQTPTKKVDDTKPTKVTKNDEDLLNRALFQKQNKKLTVTERKESAPVHRVTRKDTSKDVKMSRSTSENVIKSAPHANNKPERVPTGNRPNKCLTTKSINLTTMDRIINSEEMENVVIDIQHAKSSREPSPDKIVPTPVSIDLFTGKPRYPDVVQEPEDEPRRKPVVKNIPIFEEDSNDFVGCQIMEVKINKTVTSHDITEDHELLDSPTVEAPQSLDYPSFERPTTSEDVCLLSVHDKVTKFTTTAEEMKKPQSSKPFVKDTSVDRRTQVLSEDDECLLTVDQKVEKFLKTAKKISSESFTNTREIDVSLKPSDKLAATTPQRSPELVAKIERQISRPQVDTEDEPEEDNPQMQLLISIVQDEKAPQIEFSEAPLDNTTCQVTINKKPKSTTEPERQYLSSPRDKSPDEEFFDRRSRQNDTTENYSTQFVSTKTHKQYDVEVNDDDSEPISKEPLRRVPQQENDKTPLEKYSPRPNTQRETEPFDDKPQDKYSTNFVSKKPHKGAQPRENITSEMFISKEKYTNDYTKDEVGEIIDVSDDDTFTKSHTTTIELKRQKDILSRPSVFGNNTDNRKTIDNYEKYSPKPFSKKPQSGVPLRETEDEPNDNYSTKPLSKKPQTGVPQLETDDDEKFAPEPQDDYSPDHLFKKPQRGTPQRDTIQEASHVFISKEKQTNAYRNKEVHEIIDVSDDDDEKFTKSHTTTIELKRQKDILSRPSVFSDTGNKKPTKTPRGTEKVPQNDVLKKPQRTVSEPQKQYSPSALSKKPQGLAPQRETQKLPRDDRYAIEPQDDCSPEPFDKEPHRATPQRESVQVSKVIVTKEKRTNDYTKDEVHEEIIDVSDDDDDEKFTKSHTTTIELKRQKDILSRPSVFDDKKKKPIEDTTALRKPTTSAVRETERRTTSTQVKVKSSPNQQEKHHHHPITNGDKKPITQNTWQHKPDTNVSKTKTPTSKVNANQQFISAEQWVECDETTELRNEETTKKQQNKTKTTNTSYKTSLSPSKKPDNERYSPNRKSSDLPSSSPLTLHSTKKVTTKTTERTVQHIPSTEQVEHHQTEELPHVLDTTSKRKPTKTPPKDSVAARRNLFEKGIPSKTTPKPKANPISPEKSNSESDSGRRPSYMDHTKCSLEHIRRDSLEINKTHYSRKSSFEDDTAYEQKPNSAVKFDIPQQSPREGKPTDMDDMDNVCIEEIFDLYVLEKMLETVTSYEIRRRIRAQIRLVKKNMQNLEGTHVVTTTTKTTKFTGQQEPRERSKSPTYGKRTSVSPTTTRRVSGVRPQEFVGEEVHILRESKITSTTKSVPNENVAEIPHDRSRSPSFEGERKTSKSPTNRRAPKFDEDKLDTHTRTNVTTSKHYENIQKPRERSKSPKHTSPTTKRVPQQEQLDINKSDRQFISEQTSTKKTRKYHETEDYKKIPATMKPKSPERNTSPSQVNRKAGTTSTTTTTTTRRVSGTTSPDRSPVRGTKTTTTTTTRLTTPKEPGVIGQQKLPRTAEQTDSSTAQRKTTAVHTTEQRYTSTKNAKTEQPIDTSKSPIWANRKNILKNPSTTPRSPPTRKPATGGNDISSTRSNYTTKTTSSTSRTSSQQRNLEDTDIITSSYGIGPTDENGLPLFGIKALKKKSQSTVQPSETTKVTGYVIEEKYYADNENPQPIVERKEMIYATDADDIEDIKNKLKNESSLIGRQQQIEQKYITNEDDQVDSQDMSSSHFVGIPAGSTNKAQTTTTKYVRRGSVKEMSEKFIRKESSQSITEKSTSSYPKAGLILRTNSRSGAISDDQDSYDMRRKEDIRKMFDDNGDHDDDGDGGGEYRSELSTRTRTTYANEGESGGDVDDETECESVNVKRQTKSQKSTRSFLNSSKESKVVTGMDDVLERMRNADNVVEDGDTQEDQEARALLNKFLGASAIMSSVETMLPATTTTTKQTKMSTNADSNNFNKQQIKTTRTTHTTKSESSSSPVACKTCDIEEIWDEEILKKLLEQATTYEERRKLRTRLRQLMAEREESKESVSGVKAELSSSSVVAKDADTESSTSEYETIIEEVTDYSDTEPEEIEADVVVEEKKSESKAAVTKTVEKTEQKTEAKVETKTENIVKTKTSSENTQKSETVKAVSGTPAPEVKKETKKDEIKQPQIEKSNTTKLTGSAASKEISEGESLIPLLQDLLHKNMPPAEKTADQNSETTTNSVKNTNTRTSSANNSSSMSATLKQNSTNTNKNPKDHKGLTTTTTKNTQVVNVASATIDSSKNNSSNSSSSTQNTANKVNQLNVPQREDSGTESGEDLRLIAEGIRDKLHMQSDTNLLEEVTTALNRLESSLKEGKDLTLDDRKRNALLALVARLQTGLTTPEKLATDPTLAAAAPTMANTNSANDEINYEETSSPESDAHRSNRQRFAKRRNRNSRHTVGVSREELQDARRYMEDLLLMENISNSTTPDSSTAPVTAPNWYPLEKNASSGAILLSQPVTNLYRPNQFVAKVEPTQRSDGRSNAKRPLSGDFSVSFDSSLINPIEEQQTAYQPNNKMYSSQPPEAHSEAEHDASGKSNRFTSKKQLMKRANTIDIPKSKSYQPEFETDSEVEDKGPAMGLKRAVQVNVKQKVRQVVPPFEPKTENDHKFLAFINKQSAKPGLGWNNSKSVSNWTNKFGGIKNKFEVGAAASVTTGKPPQNPGHTTQNSAKNLWNKQMTAQPQAQMQKSQQEILEHKIRLERERLEQEHIERMRAEKQWQERERMERERIERGRIERQHLEQEHAERLRAERQWKIQAEQERMERDRLEREHFEKVKIEKQRIENAERERLEREHLERERQKREHIERIRAEQQWQERLESERMERDRIERDLMVREQIERDRLTREHMERERIDNERLKHDRAVAQQKERERQQREYYERENYEREHLRVGQNMPTSGKGMPVNKFMHAPQSVFRPVDNITSQNQALFKPINLSKNKTTHTWQSPETRMSLDSPQFISPKQIKNTASNSVSPLATSPIGLPWVSKQTDNKAFKQKASKYEDKPPYEPRYTANLLRHNSLRSANNNQQSMEHIRKRPSLPNTGDPYQYQPHDSLHSNNMYDYQPPPPTNVSFTYADYAPKSNYQSYPCLPSAVDQQTPIEHPPRSRADSLTNPQAAPLVLSSNQPLYNPQIDYLQTPPPTLSIGTKTYPRQFDYASPMDSAPTSPSFMSMPPTTDCTDDDLDSDSNIMEYRVESKVMNKPQIQTAVTVGRRTNHVSDDEVYGKNSRAARNLLYTMKNLGNNGTGGAVSEQTNAKSRPPQATSPKICLSPDGRAYQAPLVEPIFPKVTNFEANRSPLYKNSPKSISMQSLPTTATQYQQNPMYVPPSPPASGNEVYVYQQQQQQQQQKQATTKAKQPVYPKKLEHSSQQNQQRNRNISETSVSSNYSNGSYSVASSAPATIPAKRQEVPKYDLKQEARAPPSNEPPFKPVQQVQIKETKLTKQKPELRPKPQLAPLNIKLPQAVVPTLQQQQPKLPTPQAYNTPSPVVAVVPKTSVSTLQQTQKSVIVSKQQKTAQQTIEMRRKSLGNLTDADQQNRKSCAFETQRTQQSQLVEYKSSAPADTPDIVKSSLPKDENMPILKKFGPPQRHHYIPNAYQSPSTTSNITSTQSRHEIQGNTTRTQSSSIQQNRTVVQHSAYSTNKPTIVETPSTPQPNQPQQQEGTEDHIPRNIVFNNISAFSSMSRRNETDNAAYVEQINRPNRLSKCDSWTNIVQQQQLQQQQQHVQSPTAAAFNSGAVGSELRRTKSGHNLVIPKMYEAGIAKSEISEKQKTVAAYFSVKKSPNTTDNDEDNDAPVKRSTINRVRTSAKVSTNSRKSLNAVATAAFNGGGGLTRSATMPHIANINLLDESNVEDAFEQLLMGS